MFRHFFNFHPPQGFNFRRPAVPDHTQQAAGAHSAWWLHQWSSLSPNAVTALSPRQKRKKSREFSRFRLSGCTHRQFHRARHISPYQRERLRGHHRGRWVGGPIRAAARIRAKGLQVQIQAGGHCPVEDARVSVSIAVYLTQAGIGAR